MGELRSPKPPPFNYNGRTAFPQTPSFIIVVLMYELATLSLL